MVNISEQTLGVYGITPVMQNVHLAVRVIGKFLLVVFGLWMTPLLYNAVNIDKQNICYTLGFINV